MIGWIRLVHLVRCRTHVVEVEVKVVVLEEKAKERVMAKTQGLHT